MRIQRFRLLCAGSHHSFSQKAAKRERKKNEFFVAAPHRGLTLFYKVPPPLNGPRGLCTVRSFALIMPVDVCERGSPKRIRDIILYH